MCIYARTFTLHYQNWACCRHWTLTACMTMQGPINIASSVVFCEIWLVHVNNMSLQITALGQVSCFPSQCLWCFIKQRRPDSHCAARTGLVPPRWCCHSWKIITVAVIQHQLELLLSAIGVSANLEFVCDQERFVRIYIWLLSFFAIDFLVIDTFGQLLQAQHFFLGCFLHHRCSWLLCNIFLNRVPTNLYFGCDDRIYVENFLLPN